MLHYLPVILFVYVIGNILSLFLYNVVSYSTLFPYSMLHKQNHKKTLFHKFIKMWWFSYLNIIVLSCACIYVIGKKYIKRI
ncbi:hypothetical protein EST35_0341 [Pseudomonas phage vB_PaeM_PA5oct]|uniref:Uncharacterized protein n=1 Tax=Pseudomonas phage vB_PaeM_PA5oct TaxID=2163605 RepID=A0A4Y5JW50_9CAUD|nr:hypothetical protein PQE65_gp143 [Pseudomonas phage vB_PaeM_PA5oct]QCG76222.1 hypothetical protein EST35_0341 [Pseudomonas phage vB_PaeM_PA5oct]